MMHSRPGSLQPLVQCASITGADDRTAVEDLRSLSVQYPFVEWALLYVPHPGGPRNPTLAWREAFFDTKMPGSSAVHLCFKQPFEQLLAGTLPADVSRADRLQLNINARGRDFSDQQVRDVYHRALDLGPELILQYQSVTAPVVERFLSELGAMDRKRVHVLLDESRGTGVTPAEWSLPAAVANAHVGFAGGLGPDNIASALIDFDRFDVPYWVDMETRVRTDNQFDLVKVAAVLQAVSEHRETTNGK